MAQVQEAHQRVSALEAEKAETEARAIQPEVLAEREAQLAAALAQVQEAHQRVSALEAEKAETEARAIQPEVLAEREAQLTAAAAQIQALEAERASWAPSATDRIALELLGDREAQLQIMTAEAEQYRQQIDGLRQESEALTGKVAAMVTPEVLAEREAQLATTLEQARENRVQIEALETERASLAAAAAVAITPAVFAATQTEIEQLKAELAKRGEQHAQERLESEGLRAENASLEAAKMASEAAAAELARNRFRRAPFSPMRVRNVVEMSGMGAQSEFDEAEGASLADTATIKLPGAKRIVVHTLPDVSSYQSAVDAASEADCTAGLAQLAADVRAHIVGLESGNGSLAVAFLPGDVLLGAALEQDPSLLSLAAQRNVVVATPNSLVGLLGTAAASWRQHKIAEELQVARTANQTLCEQLASLSGSLEGLRNSLGIAVQAVHQYTPATPLDIGSHLEPAAASMSAAQLIE